MTADGRYVRSMRARHIDTGVSTASEVRNEGFLIGPVRVRRWTHDIKRLTGLLCGPCAVWAPTASVEWGGVWILNDLCRVRANATERVGKSRLCNPCRPPRVPWVPSVTEHRARAPLGLGTREMIF